MELKTYLLPLLRWWWLILLASAIAAATSYLTVQRQPDQFESRATLMIGQTIQDPNPSNQQLNLGSQLAQEYADIGMRNPVRRATMEALGLNRLPQYNVRALPNRQLIEVIVVDTDPTRAQAVAAELSNQLIRISPGGTQEEEQERQAFIADQLDRLQQQITATQEEILAKEQTLGELFSASDIAETQAEITALETKLNTLQANYAGLLAGTREVALNTLSLLEPASFPRRPVGPGLLQTMLAATAIAFSLAAGTAYLLEYLDDSIKSPKQVKKQFGLPVVGAIARLQNDNDSILTMRDAPRSPEAEGFRGLRLGVEFVLSSNDFKSVLITSPHQAEGKSLVAANLAVAMAQAGLRTLLIDADLHRPSQHKIFGLHNRQGLSTLLQAILQEGPLLERRHEAGDVPPALSDNHAAGDGAIIRESGQQLLHVITSGPISASPSELLVRGSVQRILDALAPRYDVIVVDSPPAMAVSDAAVLSNQVDSVFVLASAQQTRKSDLGKVLEHLDSINANVAGIILNQISPRSDDYYYHYGRYGYKADGPSGERLDGGEPKRQPRPTQPTNLRQRLFGRTGQG